LPIQCAAIQDTVVVLTDIGDLFISSSELQTWTKCSLRHEGMSLTTYQSRFALVGGKHWPSHELSNSVLTSTTGLQWEPLLPPMPTKRYGTSSVSTRSPEVLVVVGGRGSNDEDLEVVEVLHEDKWTAVDPLPEPKYSMHSTAHNGDLHFMGGMGKGTRAYTCSCSSLISSVKESASTTRDGLLWRQYQVPEATTTTISYSSRLASIDHWGIIRGFSSSTQSWEEVVSTGDIPHTHNRFTTGTVLTTGEIVIFNYLGGVYTVSMTGKAV